MKRIPTIPTMILFALSPLPLAAQAKLSLGDYLEIVKHNNLQYLAEQHNVKIADAEATALKVFPDPELSFDASQEAYSLDMGYTLELGKRSARLQVARNEAEGERLALEFFFRELRAEATEAFLDAILKKELWQVKQSSYEYMRQLTLSDSIRCALGEIGEIDVRQSRLEAATLYNEMLTQKAGYQSALALLNRYMGRAADYPLELPPNGEMPDMRHSLADLLQMGQGHRMDILLALRNNETASRMLKLARAERRPDIGIHVGYERDWKGIRPSRDMITAGISIPLKFSNANKGAVNSARFAIKQSELQLGDARNRVETEITQAYLQYEAVKEKVRQYHSRLIDESQKVLEGIVFRYRRGETGILDVLIAQRTFNDIQEQYHETVKEYHTCLVELQRSCGSWDIVNK